MVTAAEIADAWEKDRKTTEKWLDEVVMENPDFLGVLFATGVKTSMDLGAGFVDVLRLGQGAAKGGWGWAEDALRVVGIVGPLGRGAKLIHSARHARIARLLVDPAPGRNICSWVNSTKALARTGQRVYASVDDFVRAVINRSVSQASGLSLSNMVSQLQRIGIRVGSVKDVASIKQAARLLPRDGSAVLVSIRLTRDGSRGGHAFHIFYDTLGRLRISDRSGIFNSLDDLARAYQLDTYAVRSAAHMKNVFMKWVGPKGTATLAMAVDALIAPTQQKLDEIEKGGGGKPRKRITMPPMFAGQLPRVEYLTGVRARLMNLGYYDGPIPGKYDEKSRQSVIAFQRDHPPLAVDGIPGPKTQSRLKREHGS